MPNTLTKWFRLSHDLTMGEWSKAADTFIDSGNPTFNEGAETFVRAQWNSGGASARRAMFRFEVPPSGIEKNTNLASISLWLYNDGGGSANTFNTIIVAISESWLEGTGAGSATADGATWNVKDGATTHTWTTRPGEASFIYRYVSVTGNAAGWVEFPLDELVQDLAVVVGDTVNVSIGSALESGGTDYLVELYSMNNNANAGSWPDGNPMGWPTGGPDDYRPVIEVTYVDEPPTQITKFNVEPSPADPSAVKFTWSANEDPDFTAYGLYYSNISGDADYTNGTLVYQRGRGQAKILAAGVTSAESLQGSAGNPSENDLWYFSLATEDGSNTNADATYGPEFQVIRPDILGAGRRNGGATASPETRKVSNLGATTFSCGDKMCLAATGKGEDLTENFLVYRPTSIIVDWGDGTPTTTYAMKFTTFSGAEAADQLILSVTDSTIFVVGKCYVAYNGTNFDVFRVTAITGTTITIETDLAEAGRVADSIYFGYSGGDPIYGPLPEHIYTASGAFVPRAKLVNAAGFASDWTAAVSLTIATLAPVAVIDASIRNPLTTDTVRYTANRSYHRDSGRPITTYEWSLDNAGTGGDPDVADVTTTIPYTTHNHGSAGTCRVALRVKDGTTYSSTGNDWGDASNPQADVSLTVAAEGTLALPGGLTDGFDEAFTYRMSGGAKIAKVDGIDVRERVIMGDGKALIYVQLSGTAYSTPTSNVPIDVTTLHDAWTNKKGITLSMPRSTSGVATLNGYIEDFQAHRIGVNAFAWTVDAVFDAPT